VRRRVPDLQGQERRLRPRAFLQHAGTAALVADWTDDEVWQLNRGGHDIFKIFAAYNAAVTHKGAPTLILAKTIKGFGMGQAGEAMNISHQQKKMDIEQIGRFRDRFTCRCPTTSWKSCPT
jgi:pyruvate dehydrogenase E1 component